MLNFSRISVLSYTVYVAVAGLLLLSSNTCDAFTAPTSMKQRSFASTEAPSLKRAFVVKQEKKYGQLPLYLSSENDAEEKKVGDEIARYTLLFAVVINLF